MVDVDGRSSKDVSRFVSLLIFYGGGRGGGEEYYLPRVANSTCRKFEPDPPLLGDDVDLLVGRVPLLSSTRLYIYMYTYIQSIYIQSKTKSSTDYRARCRIAEGDGRGEEAARVKGPCNEGIHAYIRYIFSGRGSN